MTGARDPAPPSGEPPIASKRVTLELPPELGEAAARLAGQQRCSEQQIILELLRESLARRGADGTSALQTADAAPRDGRPPAAHAAWRVDAPPASGPAAGSHEWAENLLPTLPLRFQRYVAELLFDDERILFFLHRPPLRRRTRWWRTTEDLEGLLVITDRMVLMIEDSVPPGPMFVAWGYAAWLTAVERVSFARVGDAAGACTFLVRCNAASGTEDRRFFFHEAQRGDLLDAAALLNRYGGGGDALPARTYANDHPAWEPPERRRAAPLILGRSLDEQREEDMRVVQATVDRVQMTLQADRLDVRRDGVADTFASEEISSIALWRGVKGCTLDWHVPKDGKVRRESVVFQYPQATPFLRIASRLRHAMGRLAMSSAGSTA